MNEQQIPTRAICLLDLVVLTCSQEPVNAEKDKSKQITLNINLTPGHKWNPEEAGVCLGVCYAEKSRGQDDI